MVYLVIGMAGFALSGAATLWILFSVSDVPSLWIPAGFGAVSALGLALVFAHHRVRCQLTTNGFDFTPLMSRGMTVRWAAIDKVKWTRWSHMVFRLQDGPVVRIPADLVGIPWFAGHVLSKVPRARFAPNAWTVLTKLANGAVARGFGRVA